MATPTRMTAAAPIWVADGACPRMKYSRISAKGAAKVCMMSSAKPAPMRVNE